MRRLLLLIFPALALLAHHSVDAVYNRSVQAEYRAAITGVTWTNPHATFTATVASPGGSTVTWTFESAREKRRPVAKRCAHATP